MKKSLVLLIATMLMLSCSSESCEDLLCTTGPPGFAFELADKESGENLFSNGTFDPGDIHLRNEEGASVSYIFSGEHGRNIIQTGLEPVPEVKSFFLGISSDLEIEIRYGVEQRSEDCCSFYEILEFSIPDYESNQSQSTGIYTIFVD